MAEPTKEEGAAAAAPSPISSKPRQSGLANIFLPNRGVSANVMRILVLAQFVLLFVLWSNSQIDVIPRPGEVLASLGTLWRERGLIPALASSFVLNLEALGWTLLISLTLSYLTVLPFFRPIANGIARGRFLSLVGFSFVFTLIFGGGHAVKLSLLVFGMTVYFVTSMVSTIAAIPKADFDHARTLQMTEWRVVWEVVVLGTIDKVFENLRQNAAIGWTLLTMVESIVRSEGGIGVLLRDQEKYLRVSDIFAIQLSILLLGLFQDFGIRFLRSIVCPYADLTLERKEG